jgi:GT2 family glycosyltransferase
LEAGLGALLAEPSLGVVQGRTIAPPGVDVWGLTDWSLWRIVESPEPYFEGCNIFYRRAALAQAGGFDEEIQWWGEDTALGWRVIEAGWGRHFEPAATVAHEVQRRGWRWFVRNGLREHNVVRLAAQYPGFRAEAFWQSWAYRRDDAAFVLAVGAATAAVTSRRLRLLAVATLPYLWWRRPSLRQPAFVRLALQTVVVDAARCAGQLSAAVRCRIFVI